MRKQEAREILTNNKEDLPDEKMDRYAGVCIKLINI